MKVLVAGWCPTPWTAAHQAPLSMESSRQNAGMGNHFLLQGFFPTQGLNLSLLHCRRMLYHLSHQGSPSHTYIHVSILHQTPLPSRLPHNIELSSMCYTVDPCWLSLLNTAEWTCPSQTPLPLILLPTATLSSFSKSESLSVLEVHLYHFFLDSTHKEPLKVHPF